MIFFFFYFFPAVIFFSFFGTQTLALHDLQDANATWKEFFSSMILPNQEAFWKSGRKCLLDCQIDRGVCWQGSRLCSTAVTCKVKRRDLSERVSRAGQINGTDRMPTLDLAQFLRDRTLFVCVHTLFFFFPFFPFVWSEKCVATNRSRFSFLFPLPCEQVSVFLISGIDPGTPRTVCKSYPK